MPGSRGTETRSPRTSGTTGSRGSGTRFHLVRQMPPTSASADALGTKDTEPEPGDEEDGDSEKAS